METTHGVYTGIAETEPDKEGSLNTKILKVFFMFVIGIICFDVSRLDAKHQKVGAQLL